MARYSIRFHSDKHI